MKTDFFDADKNQSSRVVRSFGDEQNHLTSEADKVKPEIDPQVTELLAVMQEKDKKRRLPKRVSK